MIHSMVLLLSFISAQASFPDLDDEDVIDFIRRQGGKVTQDDQQPGRPVVSINLHGKKVTDESMKDIAKLRNVKELWLGNTGVTTAGLQHLANIPNLQSLHLGSLPINDDALRDLPFLKKLDKLVLTWTKVTDAGMKELSSYDRLRRLNLGCTKVTDVGLKEIAKLKHLKSLELYHTEITDQGLKEIARLTELRVLDVMYTKITPAGIMEFAEQARRKRPDLATIPGAERGYVDALRMRYSPKFPDVTNAFLLCHAEVDAAGEKGDGSPDRATVRKLIDQLESANFKTREKATLELSKLEEVPEDLRDAMKNGNLEVSRRAQLVINTIMASQLAPAGWTEGSAYEWKGVFTVEGDAKNKTVFLCNSRRKDVRIRVAPAWAALILREWQRFEGREIHAYSRNPYPRLDFYLLQDRTTN